jgi:cytoskeletal protein RodZ
VTDTLHKLGEVLRTARESKGVDLARVERDTKIRARYLAALEKGDYRDLPGAVYTKGFLRNYGQYLGVDPEYLVDLYRIEIGGGAAERLPTAPPRPITVRGGRAFVITPAAVLVAILTVGVILFVAYLGYEFVTFAGAPVLKVTEPSGDVASWPSLQYTVKGVTEPNSRVTIDGLRENPQVMADGDGNFQVVVTLVPGSNVITVSATDPRTGRDANSVTRTITVGSGGTPTPGAPALAVAAPQEGATVSSPVEVSGTARPGERVTIRATLVRAGSPGFTITDFSGAAVKMPTPTPGQPVTATVTAGSDGSFATTVPLGGGSWELSISAAPAGLQSPAASASAATSSSSVPTTAVKRAVTVKDGTGLTGSLVVAGGISYIEIDEDGKPLAGVSGRNIPSGRTIQLSAKATLRIKAGNAGAVTLVVNGISLGKMGGPGTVIEWRISASG